MNCFFQETDEFNKLKPSITSTNSFDVINGEKVPEQFKIEFICSNNPKVLQVRNVNDLFYIILNSISNIKVSYIETHGDSDDESAPRHEYAYETQSAARDPIINYDFTREQIEYIRQYRKSVMCNNTVRKIIVNYSNLSKDKVKDYIKEHKINCSELIIQSMYCKNEKKNEFIWDLLQICKTIDKYTLIFAVKEGLDEKIVEFLLEFYDKNEKTCGGVNIMDEMGNNVYNLIENRQYDKLYKKYDFNDQLIFRTNDEKLWEKLYKNGLNLFYGSYRNHGRYMNIFEKTIENNNISLLKFIIKKKGKLELSFSYFIKNMDIEILKILYPYRNKSDDKYLFNKMSRDQLEALHKDESINLEIPPFSTFMYNTEIIPYIINNELYDFDKEISICGYDLLNDEHQKLYRNSWF